MNLKTIREAKAAKVAEARTIVNKADTEKRSLSAEESTAFDKLKGEITDLESQEARAQFLADAERAQTGTVVAGNGERGLADLERRVSVLRVVQAAVEGKPLSGAEAEYNAEIARRNGRPAQGVYLPMVALEKRVNDLLGHQRGDQTLIEIAQAIRGVFRASDVTARLGGDALSLEAARFRVGAELPRKEKQIARFDGLRITSDGCRGSCG